MELSTGDFIYHPHYGVGRVQDLEAQNQIPSGDGNIEFKIIFQNGDVKNFTQELLSRGAYKISPAGFRAYAYMNEAGAKELLEANPVEAITMVLQDFPGQTAKNEDFKDYLSSYIQNWADWWETAQPKLKDSPQIDTSRSKFREYGLRKDSLSQAEEHYRAFRRTRSFDDKSHVYDRARSTLKQHLDGAPLNEEHLQEVLDYLRQIIETDGNLPAMRLDAIFRMQEGKWLTNEETTDYITRIIKSGFRLYQLDLYSLNRTVEYLLENPVTAETESLLASAICSGESAIKAVSDWALKRGDTKFIALLLMVALSENIPPQLEKEDLDTLSIRLKSLVPLVKCVEIENEAWSLIITHYQNLITEISRLDEKVTRSLFPAVIEFSQALYERLNPQRSELAENIFDNFLDRNIPKQFILGLLDFARVSKHFSEFGYLLEQRFWADGGGRNLDFIKELTQSKGTTVEQIKSLMDKATQFDSYSLKGHIGTIVCDLIKKDEKTDRILLLPYLNQLHNWEGKWEWSNTVEGLRETIYLDWLEHSRGDIGDNALLSAVYRFLNAKTKDRDAEIARLKDNVHESSLRIHELEGLLAEKEQAIRELRSGYGGDTAEARFNEKVRVVKDLAFSVAEFERMEAKNKEKSREVQAIILRLNSLLTGLNVSPMETIGTQVQFNPQKHQAIDSTVSEPGEMVIIVERGYLIRDHSEKLRLLKSALVKK